MVRCVFSMSAEEPDMHKEEGSHTEWSVIPSPDYRHMRKFYAWLLIQKNTPPQKDGVAEADVRMEDPLA